MSAMPLIAADVGNARIKLGLFSGEQTENVPEPERTLSLQGGKLGLDKIGPWLETADLPPVCKHTPYGWFVASVNRPAATHLIDWLKRYRPDDHVTLLTVGDLPIDVRVPEPDRVGIDRLVDAVAVNRLRRADRPAAIVDVGSAVTVDLVSADGAFLGGAILPGMAMAARALHHFTDRLPMVNVSDLEKPPPALGTSTDAAIQSGLFWGAVGAIRQLIEQLGETAGGVEKLDVFITGGAGAAVAGLLGDNVRYEPNLTLFGIALAAAKGQSPK